ncbi:PREDICTED: transmembrane protease serine 12-like, partial [Acanthisitta chloris]|uniref:transmembrane protease serine 12-like n=1 Tax=Acanthisitta chloris TaxID=57068 RepID=UPI0004F0C4E5
NPRFWRAVLGTHNLYKLGPDAVKRKIKKIIVHPKFRRETFENDLAMFELRSAVRSSHYIQPICLPSAQLAEHLENSSICSITGWGRTAEKGDTPPGLQPCSSLHLVQPFKGKRGSN